MGVVAVFVGLDLLLGPHADGAYPAVVTGTVMDAETGRPLSRVWVMSLPSREWAEDPAQLRKWTDRVRLAKGTPMSRLNGGWTDDSGRFRFAIDVPWGWKEGGITGALFSRTRPPLDHVVKGCVIARAPGRGRVLVDFRDGAWTGRWTGDPERRLDMGVMTVK